ncbi:uncharacterized protein SAPINGB_P001210 [Magnusiomyces paraingens]|uniref:K Homology domain-containing protein n=1 Tax=Magnusiomyces paraingens TaxID=2606893 RepID=A0A5E8B4J3_9ASCO|nr:uncharacterized protein SAPINGB_P001210 [Saprochaete ingens]VVT46431.1 unnamed protein product [Saprochaete ingens]
MATLEDSTSSSLAQQLMARHQIADEASAIDSAAIDSVPESSDAESSPSVESDLHSEANEESVPVSSDGESPEPAPDADAESDEVPDDSADATPVSASAAASKPKSKKKTNKIDVSSFDAFPKLGGSAPVVANTSWGKGPAIKPIRATGSASPKPHSQVIRAPPKAHVVTDNFTLSVEERSPRAKNIPADVLNRAINKNNVTINCSTSKQTGASTFIIKGKAENVQQARRDLLRDLTVHISETILVPASSRSSIIGPKGSNLRPIITKSGTQIQVSKQDEVPVVDDEDDEPVVEVIIEGDREGVEIAKKEIFAIVNSRVRKAKMKINNVPSKVYPALAGVNNATIAELEKTHGVKIDVPDHFYLAPQNLQVPIVISGERNAVIEVKAQLEALAQNILSSSASFMKNISKAHQLFISPNDVFVKTGVVVSPTANPEQWELFGHASQVEAANLFVSEAGKNIQQTNLIISKAHDGNIKHSQILTLYFKNSDKLKALEEKNSVIITTPSDDELYDPETKVVALSINGNVTDNIQETRKELVNLVNKYSPSRIMLINDIDPFFFKTLTPKSKHILTIKNEHHVETFVPEPSRSAFGIVLVYEGDANLSEDDFAPGVSEIKEHLLASSKVLDDLRAHQKDIVTSILSVPVEDQKYILGPNGTTLSVILKGVEHEAPVYVHFGNDERPEGADASVELTPESVYVRGLSKQVKYVIKEIEEAVETGRNYEVLSSYTTQFQFPKEHVNKLIGKGGSNLSKLRDEFGVKIDVDPEGQGVIKGIKKNADEAKLRIHNMGKRWADEVTLRLSIPNEYHATLIGTGGKFVKRLEEKYDVFIKFPRGNSGSNGDNDDSARDRPSNQDEVVVRGPSRGAEKAKDEILELVQYEKDNSNSDIVYVPAKALSRIIGRNGEFINDIKDTTNTRIDVGERESAGAADAKVAITIVGTKSGIKQAIERINEVVKEIEDTVTEEIEVDPKYHRYLIGANGSAMREIITKAGETFNPRLIQVPQAGSGSSKIKVHGKKKVVNKIISIINSIVEERENQVELLVPISVERHGAIIGPGGQSKKEIETEFNVSINVPYQGSKNAKGDLDRNIRVVGTKENVEKAKAKILEIAADDAKVDVPIEYNNLVFDSGMLIKKLRSDFDVRVDLGRTTFSKDTISKIPEDAIGEALITDDDLSAKFKWTTVSEEAATPVTGKAAGSVITWRFKGNAENTKKAKAVVEKALERVKKYDTTGYLWLADSSKYRLVIGPSGSTINNIREESECSVAIPKNGAKKNENVIVIRGEKSNTEKALGLILDIVKAN